MFTDQSLWRAFGRILYRPEDSPEGATPLTIWDARRRVVPGLLPALQEVAIEDRPAALLAAAHGYLEIHRQSGGRTD